MNFEDLEEQAIHHSKQHRTNTAPFTQNFSCQICYPVTREPSPAFTNFWNCVKTYHHARHFTSYTVTAFAVYIGRYNRTNNPTDSTQVVRLLSRTLTSLRYRNPPLPLINVTVHLLYLTEATNYYQQPVTVALY